MGWSRGDKAVLWRRQNGAKWRSIPAELGPLGSRAAAAQQDAREALGRSRGGYGSKACVIADGAGRAIAFRLAPGQAHELPQAMALLACLPYGTTGSGSEIRIGRDKALAWLVAHVLGKRPPRHEPPEREPPFGGSAFPASRTRSTARSSPAPSSASTAHALAKVGGESNDKVAMALALGQQAGMCETVRLEGESGAGIGGDLTGST